MKKHLNLHLNNDLSTFVEVRAGHDKRYVIDACKIENELGWYAVEDCENYRVVFA